MKKMCMLLFVSTVLVMSSCEKEESVKPETPVAAHQKVKMDDTGGEDKPIPIIPNP